MFIMFLFDQLHPDMQCWVEKKNTAVYKAH